MSYRRTFARRLAWAMRIATKCPSCGRFRSRPSSLCPRDGHCYLRVGQDSYQCDRENGWDYV